MTVRAVLTPSATCCISAVTWSSDLPRASSSPTRRLRDSWLMHVAIRSPRPVSPEKVRGSAPIASPSRVISASPRVMTMARVLSPTPSPSAMPAAIAMMFLRTPPSSLPMTSSLRYTRKTRERKSGCSAVATWVSGVATTAAAA